MQNRFNRPYRRILPLGALLCLEVTFPEAPQNEAPTVFATYLASRPVPAQELGTAKSSVRSQDNWTGDKSAGMLDNSRIPIVVCSIYASCHKPEASKLASKTATRESN